MEMPTSVATLMAGARSAVATWLWASKHRVWQQAQVQHWGRKLWGHRGQRSLSIQNSLCQSEALLSDQVLSVCRPAHTM
ncbi:hypothetical protein BDV33DRAFT_195661 [Aspergillus novoparasiticus]|uniref:Uncharacterized protein n=1 Tax=Aspergillus novoparasiticus TaxID=986946 RepID=A0A5N6EBG6_9EURO|nr:hypothetical protein BDV33DRAFT_195661 [Aspergillus novoparasiticus]